MRLSLRPATSHSVVHVDADGVAAAARVLTTLNAPTYAPLPTPKPTWSLASFALRALAGSLDALELDMDDAPTLGLTPRADVFDDLLPAYDDEKEEEDPRVWSALALAYGCEPRRMPLSDPHLFALPQPVVLDFSFSAPGMRTPFDDAAAVNLLAADLRALVLLDLSGQTGLSDRGLKALARAQGTRGLRALALRGCTGVGVEGVTACALAWERLEVLDIRGTRCPKGTTIPGFAPRPPALLAESHFHPSSPEQVARALLGKDTPFILVDEEDFGCPARRRPVLDRPRLVDLVRERAPPPVPAEPVPRVFTTSMPEPGVLLVDPPPPPPPPPPPEPSLPPEPTTMDELRARRLAAFGVAPPAPSAPAPSHPPLPTPPTTAAPASSSVWTRAPTAQNPLWNDLLARHQPRPHPHPTRPRVPRRDMVISQHIRTAGSAPARAPSHSPSPSRSSSRSRSSSPNPWALPSLSSPSPSRSPSPPPTKRPRLSNPYTGGTERRRVSNPYSSADVAGSKRKPRASKAERAILANNAERARFAARLADEGALMFVRVGPPPPSSSSAQKVVREEAKVEGRVKVRSNADLRAHLAGVMGRRGGTGTGGGGGVGTGMGTGGGVSVGGGVSASAAAPVARRVPFAKAARGQKRGLSTWHDVQARGEGSGESSGEVSGEVDKARDETEAANVRGESEDADVRCESEDTVAELWRRRCDSAGAADDAIICEEAVLRQNEEMTALGGPLRLIPSYSSQTRPRVTAQILRHRTGPQTRFDRIAEPLGWGCNARVAQR